MVTQVVRDSHLTPARSYAPGIGKAVADRTVNRKIMRQFALPRIEKVQFERNDHVALDELVAEWCRSNGYPADSQYVVQKGGQGPVMIDVIVMGQYEIEEWEDVARRVAIGNTLLDPKNQRAEFHALNHHLRQASILMSGRHLQHGDETQPLRPQEVFTNCSTAAATFLSFYLLLNGSGVGRAYDDAMMLVDWHHLPVVVPVIDANHPDCLTGEIQILDRKNAEHLYAGCDIHHFEVPDSREGWAKAVEKMELMAFQKHYRDAILMLDFSKVRCKGSPIGGMQGRPASGPGTLIQAIMKVAALRDTQMEPWRAAMFADHYMAECVLVGGARRAARMSTKTWRDRNVVGFVQVKRGGFLWSSNNSVTVDDDFWRYCKMTPEEMGKLTKAEYKLACHAKAVLDAVAFASYHDGTGEPGFINQAKLTQKDDGEDVLMDGNFAESKRYKLEPETLALTAALAREYSSKSLKMITNPCSEVTLSMLGAYCVIADVVPYHTISDEDAEEAFRVTTRALIRVNQMDCLYRKEVNRTNRIGVGLTGLHEYAFRRFQYGWKDLVDEEKSKDFWLMLSRFKRAVVEEAENYSHELGMAVPHTNTTIKPSGTVSKLFGLTEGAHLPSMREYLRWVQFRNGDPLVAQYEAKGYPVKRLKTYSGTTIVGFPTQPEICKLGMGDLLVTAAEATPEEQYQYLRLLEKYYIRGVEEDGVTPLAESGNQISYTLKYDPKVVDYAHFKQTLLDGQSTVRCCSVMPQTDATAYEYQPETPVSKHEYQRIVDALTDQERQEEDVSQEHVDACATGACPISFSEKKVSING